MSKIVHIDPDAEWAEKYTGRATLATHYVGVDITLDDGRHVKFGISNGQHCCESWDYLHPADDYSEYIGAEYLGLREIDTWPEFSRNKYEYECGFQAIEVMTSKGPLQFVVYNDHNGFYSHAVITVEGDKVEVNYL